jgi:hypothetical protein
MQRSALPWRNATDNGISPEQTKLSDNARSEICSITNDYKQLYCAFIATDEVRRMSMARTEIEFPSLKTSGFDTVAAGNGTAFISIAFCKNAHANAHIDSGMCQGLIAVHKQSVHFVYCQHILAYFCIQCLSVAVLFHPGDAIIVNPCKPHCLSSFVDVSEYYYLLVMYLKKSVIELNDNILPLTQVEDYICCKL